MGPVTLCRPGGVTAEGGDTSETGELTVLLGGVFPDAALRRFLTPNSVESFLPNTFLLDLNIKKNPVKNLCKLRANAKMLLSKLLTCVS